MLWVWGKSGSGKGGLIKLIGESFGDKAITVTRGFVERQGGDIDDALANILEKQPLIILLDEIGTSKGIDEGRALSRFGDTEQSARRPHGFTITGSIFGMLVASTVTPPNLPAKAGFKRRSAVLKTLDVIPTARKQPVIAQDLKDAVITLGALRAREHLAAIDAGTFVEPEGDAAKTAEFLREMDPVGMWLEDLPDDCERMTMQELADKANDDMDVDQDVTPSLIGRRVKSSDKWRRAASKTTSGERVKVIRLKQSAAEPALVNFCANPQCKFATDGTTSKLDVEGLCLKCHWDKFGDGPPAPQQPALVSALDAEIVTVEAQITASPLGWADPAIAKQHDLLNLLYCIRASAPWTALPRPSWPRFRAASSRTRGSPRQRLIPRSSRRSTGKNSGRTCASASTRNATRGSPRRPPRTSAG